MKLKICIKFPLPDLVAPYAGAWIEIWKLKDFLLDRSVAPYAGVWSEIQERHPRRFGHNAILSD